jgi:signal transduction histidine kinase
MITVVVMLLVFLTQVAAAVTWPGVVPGDIAWNRIVSRVAYLLITGYVAGFLSEQSNALRAEMAAVADAIHQARVELGLGGSVTALARLLLKMFDAAAVDVVVHEGNTDRALLWRVTAGRDGIAPAINRRELNPGDERQWFFDDDANTWHATLEDGRVTRARAVQSGAWPLRTQAIDVPVGVLPAAFNTVTVTNVGLEPEWRGRIFIYDLARRGALPRRLHFLDSLTAHLTPSLTNVVLMRRLRSQAGAAERARVARELHDGTIQALFGIEMKLEALRRGVRGNPALLEGLEDVQTLLRAEILGMRELMQALRPVELDAVHQLPEVLASVVERFRRDSGISARFVSNLETLQLTPSASIEVVRIVQEALANVRKHSRARNVLVRFTGNGDAYTLAIEDDGRGFEFSGSLSHDQLDRAHVGPAIIKERARLLGGHVTVESTPGEGARIEITFGVPVHA